MFQRIFVSSNGSVRADVAMAPMPEAMVHACIRTLASPGDETMDEVQPESEAAPALATLPPQDRAVLLLWDAGMRYAEISDRTRMGIEEVGARLVRARRALLAAHDSIVADRELGRGVDSRLTKLEPLSELVLLGLAGAAPQMVQEPLFG
jgi:hypothetical protein